MTEAVNSSAKARKLEAEIRKLEVETAVTRGGLIRGWITSLSLTIGILVSCVGLYKSLNEIAFKNRQLAIEASIRSQEVFLNNVLDRISGVKVRHEKVDENGEVKFTGRDRFGGTTQVGAYAAAVSLSCEFANLRSATKEALRYQIESSSGGDERAQRMLTIFETECESETN